MAKLSSDSLTGLPRIDGQHERIFTLIGRLRESLQSHHGNQVLRDILADLRTYALIHFRDEERMLAKLACPTLESQREQHQEFVAKVEEWERAAAGANAIVPLIVYRFLHDWLTRHIQIEDMKYARWIKRGRDAA